MVRVLAEFDDPGAAFDAVQGMAASSYNVDDLELRAVCADGTSPDIPVREESYVVLGFFGGGVLGILGGIVVSLTALPNTGTPASTVAVGIGLGAAVGAAMGIGWWRVRIAKQQVPADATGFVLVVTVPEGRVPATRADLERLGGREAAPRLID